MTQQQRQNEKLLKLIGNKFGKLTIIEITDNYNKSNKRLVKCLCDCGNEKIAALEYLKSGGTSSCGCAAKEASLQNIKIANKILLETGVTKEPKIASAVRVYRNYKDGDLTFEDFYTLSQMNCFYCGQIPKNIANTYKNGKKYNYGYTSDRVTNADFVYNGLDRIDNDLGHYKNNVVPCCRTCNIAKNNGTQSDFFKRIKAIYELHFVHNKT